jgi:hypothetical protein
MAVLPATALAGAATVQRQSGKVVEVSENTNICGWPSTFTGTKQFHFDAVTTDGHVHILFHETFNYSVVAGDDPSVPVAFRGVTWSGRNEETFVANIDLASSRMVTVDAHPFAEGPFHGFLDRSTFVVAADGTVRVDSELHIGPSVDCAALTP